MSLKELLELPAGHLAIAAISRDDPKLPVAVVIIADAGENQKKLTEVLDAGDQAGRGSRQQDLDRIVQRADARISSSSRPRTRTKKEDEGQAGKLPRASPGLDQAGQPLLHRQRRRRRQGPGRSSRRARQLAGQRESFTKTQAKTDRPMPR